MENRYQSLADELEQRIQELLARYEALEMENSELTLRLSSTEQSLIESQDSLETYKSKYERLKLAKAFGMSEESKKEANQRISQMVRDIESCLALLNE